MKRTLGGLVALLWIGLGGLHAQESVSPEGLRLASWFQSSGVDHLWLMGFHVNWETGEALSPSPKATTTHCSAYVAALLKRQDIFILRPPEHSAAELANAQWDYLGSPRGYHDGWRELVDVAQVQARANEGFFVVAVVKNLDEDKPGHIAFVMPQSGTPQGWQDLTVAQAGHVNGVGLPFLQGFGKHRRELAAHRLKFFYNVAKARA